MARNKTQKPRSQWRENFVAAYRITKMAYSWLPIALLAGIIVPLLLGIGIAFATKNYVYWIITGVLLAIVIPTGIIALLSRKAQYKQIEGQPGATPAVIDAFLGRGWNYSTEPVRFFPTKDNREFVWRLVGKPGVVLVAEGAKGRANKLIQQEKMAIRRTAGKEVPVTAIFVGDGENGTVQISKLVSTIKKLPKAITSSEVAALVTRLERASSTSIPIPKGIDPYKTRVSRRALRG
ncbi:MAG: DUF4191 family protein [Actinomycetaceae bacterium]|nr:DUF4191 family protein [Actinomycetaceae bacterium]